jgi:hypothetical protein
MRRYAATLALSLSFAWGALADEPAPKPQPEDFVAGLELEGQPGLAVQTLLLPLAVYRGASADLSDLSVFDGEGKPVGWALRAAPELAPSERQERALAAFPIYGQEAAQASALRLELARARDGGSVLDIHAVGPESTSKEGKLLAYILDTKQPSEPLNALDFTLSETQPNALFALTVEGSDDLSSWQVLVQGAAIGQLNHQGQTVARTRITLPATRAAFLRLTWSGSRADDVPFSFTRVSAESERVHSERARALRHVTIGPVALKDGVYRLDLGGSLSLFSIAPLLPKQDVLLKVVLSLGELGASGERPLFSGQLYRLEHASATLTSPPIPLHGARARLLNLRVDTRAAEPPKQPLAFDVGYAPHQLLYVAHGAGPHLLAFGSHRRDGAAYEAQQLIAFLTPEQRAALPLESARVTGQRTLSGEAALSQPKTPLPLRTVLLWSVLVAGAATLILLALALLRKNEKP